MAETLKNKLTIYEPWGIGYYAEGASGSRGPESKPGDRVKVEAALVRAYKNNQLLDAAKDLNTDSPQ